MDTILRLPAVKAATGKSRSSIYQGMADGTFPRCVGIGPRAIGWRQGDLETWQKSLRGKNAKPLVPMAPARENGKGRAAVTK